MGDQLLQNNNPLALQGLAGGVADMTDLQQQHYGDRATMVRILSGTQQQNDQHGDPNLNNTRESTDPARGNQSGSTDTNNGQDDDDTEYEEDTGTDTTTITTAMPGNTENNTITMTSDMFNQILQATRSQDNNLIAGLLQQSQQNYIASLGDHRAQMEAILKTNRNTENDEEKEAGKQKTVDTYDIEIDEMIDDMNQNLCIARYLPMPVDLKISQAMIPAKVKPVRTNYNLEEFGITMNKFSSLHHVHDRRYSGLQLKSFRHENLARIDVKNQVQLDGRELKVKDSDQNLGSKWQALLSLMNFHILSTQTCPGNSESLTLMAAVFNYTLGGYPDPSSADISELFVRWILLRSSNVGKAEYITYKVVFDMLKDIVNSRLSKVANLVHQTQAAKIQIANLTKENTDPNRGQHKGGGGGGPARKTGTKNQGRGGNKRPGGSVPPQTKRPRGPNICRNYNTTAGCFRAPGDGVANCTVKSGPLIHACDFRQPSGLICGQTHPRHSNH